jgi:riboflavin synthase
VNLERPVRAGDELGGHVVQGHVDGVGDVVSLSADGRLRIATPLTRYIVEKGSVTLNGVSLTVTAVDAEGFEVALIPHTLEVTNLGQAKQVNIEVDVLAKYVEKLIQGEKRCL